MSCPATVAMHLVCGLGDPPAPTGPHRRATPAARVSVPRRRSDRPPFRSRGVSCLGWALWVALLWAVAPLPFLRPVEAARPLGARPARLSDDQLLDLIQRRAFRYFLEAANPENGLVLDRADNHRPVALDYSPATVAGSGFGLAAWCIGAERGWISRDAARQRVRRTLRFFLERMPHQRGFFAHFVDARTGQRVWDCEISSIDTGLFLGGVMAARGCFAGDPEIVALADRLLDRVDWNWMRGGTPFLKMGWKPETGFLEAAWDHYSESIIIQLLALGARRHAIPDTAWRALRRTFGEYGGQVFIGYPALFTHQFSHLFVDLRDRADAFADYFENSQRATLANRQFCLDLRPAFKTFHEDRWGLTACIGPDGYIAYGAPPGIAIVDGTVAPAGAGCSIMFTPDLAIRSLRHLYEEFGDRLWGRYGFADSFNLDRAFVATDCYAINQGPLLLAIENYRSGRIWRWVMADPRIQRGLTRAGLIAGRPPPPPPDPATVIRTNPYLPWERPEYRSTPISPRRVAHLLDAVAPAWRELPAITLDATRLRYGFGPSPTFRAVIQTAHTPSLLLVRFDVQDPDPENDHPTERLFLGNSLEFFLDPQGDGFRWGGADDLQIIVAPRPATGTRPGGTSGPRGKSRLRLRECFHPASTTRSLHVTGEADRHGYRGVLILPRGPLGLTGQRIGFCPAARDIDRLPKPVLGPGDTVKWGRDASYAWYFAEPGPLLGVLWLP